jgi:serine/threonine protein kinase
MLASASDRKSVTVLRQSTRADDTALDQSARSNRQSVGRSLPFLVKLSMARDAAAGVAFLHTNRMMHCDIKSLNFLGIFIVHPASYYLVGRKRAYCMFCCSNQRAGGQAL